MRAAILRAVDKHGERFFDYALWFVISIALFAVLMCSGLSAFMVVWG